MTDCQSIVNRYGPAVWRTVYRLLDDYDVAADCRQETFLAALKFVQREQVRDFPSLLKRLATARAIDRLRQRI